MNWSIQLLPDRTQCKVLIEALRRYSDTIQGENQEEAYLADELRLSILSKMRQRDNQRT